MHRPFFPGQFVASVTCVSSALTCDTVPLLRLGASEFLNNMTGDPTKCQFRPSPSNGERQLWISVRYSSLFFFNVATYLYTLTLPGTHLISGRYILPFIQYTPELLKFSFYLHTFFLKILYVFILSATPDIRLKYLSLLLSNAGSKYLVKSMHYPKP